MKKRLLSLLLAIVMVLGLCPITAFAASTTYITVKEEVPVWSSYSSSSTKKYTISDKGTTVTVTGSKLNSSLNWWYQLSDGNWVYSGNVEKHTSHDYTGGICNDCGYEYPYTTTSMSSTTYIVTNTSGASIWSRPYSNNSTKKSTASYGSTLTIVGKATNEDGNLWYKTSSGTWVYSGNVAAHTSHSYSGGICKDCGYEWPYTTTSMSSTTYVVTNTSGASIWSRPYSNNSTLKSTASYGSTLTIVGKTTNQAGNLWYKTSSGTWVYSGNVEQQASTFTVTYNANGGSSAPSSSKISYGGSLTTSKPTRDGYTFLGWSTSKTATVATYQAGAAYKGSSDVTLYAVWEKNETTCTSHSYTGGICNNCGYEWPYTTTSMTSATYVVTNTSGASIWNRPYSNNSTKMSTASYGSTLTIVGKTTNQAGNLWYKTSGGTWVYSGNVEQQASAFTVTYNANGGSSAPSSSKISYGGSLTTSIPTRSGYTFLGWSASKTATTAQYKSGATYNGNSDVTLYAVWSVLCTNHSYTSASGDVCTTCGATYEPTYTSVNATYYAIKDGVSVRYAPYADSGDVTSTLNAGESVYISYMFKNSLGNTWYKTKDGLYIYSENLTSNKNYDFETTTSTTTSGYIEVTKPTVFSTTEKNVKVYNDYTQLLYASHYLSTQGTLVTIVSTKIVWGNGNVQYGETINGTWIDMSYLTNNDIQPPATGLYVVTTNNTPLRKEASSSATTISTLAKGEQVKIVDTFYNDKGNPWGETSNGYMVYMDNWEYTVDSLVIKINGNVLELSADAYLTNGTTMVPIRDVAEALGASVEWDDDSGCVIIQKGLTTAVLKVYTDKLYADEVVSLNVNPVLINGKTYVPVRAISEIFGATVEWVSGTNTVEITYDPGTDDDILDDFIYYQFNQYAMYGATFVSQNANTGLAFSYVLSNIGTALESMLSFENCSEEVISENLEDLLYQIMLVEWSNYSKEYVVDYIAKSKDAQSIILGSNYYEQINSCLASTGDANKLADYSTDLIAYLLTDYSRHIAYLDLIEELYDPASKGQQHIFDQLRVEYTNTYLGIAIKALDEIQSQFVSFTIKNSSTLLSGSTAFIEAAMKLTGVAAKSNNTMDASIGLSLAGGVLSNYSTLYAGVRNNSTFLPSVSTSQSQWDEVVTNFIAAKGATLYVYEKMYNATSDEVMKVYLKVQMNTLERIQINTDIATARKTPYYLDEVSSLL